MFADGLDSQTVGYTTTDLQPDTWTLAASQFLGIGGDTVLLSDLVKGDFVAVPFDEDFIFMETAPQIEVNGNNFFYVSYESEEFWFDSIAVGPDEGTPIEVGTGLWIKQNSGPALYVRFAGQVSDDATEPLDLIGGTWNLVANPYPKSFSITDIAFEGLVAVPFDEDFVFMETAPQIEANGNNYFYINYESEDFWFDSIAVGPYEGEPIAAGVGFWFKAQTDVTATFSL